MKTYVRTDERQDVLASLDHCARCLAETEHSDGAWKWVILSLHSALQGAMVCHLSGTAEAGALTPTCARKWFEWHACDRRDEIANLEEGVDKFGSPVRSPRIPSDQPHLIKSQAPESYSEGLIHHRNALNLIAAESLGSPPPSENHLIRCTVYETTSPISAREAGVLSCN